MAQTRALNAAGMTYITHHLKLTQMSQMYLVNDSSIKLYQGENIMIYITLVPYYRGSYFVLNHCVEYFRGMDDIICPFKLWTLDVSNTFTS